MANHKSAAKRARQTLKKTAQNSRIKKTIRTFEKKLRTAIASKDVDTAQKDLISFTSRLDKAAQKGAIHVKATSRKISRLASQVHSLSK